MEKEVKGIIDISKHSLPLVESILNKKPESIISVTKEGKEWRVLAEVLERKAVPDTQDILGRYELKLDENANLLGYKQVMLRRRADLVTEEE